MLFFCKSAWRAAWWGWFSILCSSFWTRRCSASSPGTLQHATFCGFVSTCGSPRTRWICDIIMFLLIKSVAIKLGTFQGFFTQFCNTPSVLDDWGIGFWFDSLGVLAASNNILNQITRPIVGNRLRLSRWHKHFLVCDFFRFHRNCFRDTISWECVVKDDCVRSCLTKLQSFSLSKLYIDPIHRILVPFPLLLVHCKTWFSQIKLLRISVVFYSWDSRL